MQRFDFGHGILPMVRSEDAEALRKDAERLDWLLWKLPGDAIRYCVGELSDTSDGAEFRAAIDAAMAMHNAEVRGD